MPTPSFNKGKLRKEISGTFSNQARREDIVKNGKAKKTKVGFGFCTSCNALYFDKHWHAPYRFPKTTLLGTVWQPTLCDECAVQKKKVSAGNVAYAGEVVIDGLESIEDRSELQHLIRNIGKRAVARDPEERIVKIIDKGKKMIVYTSENQLAVSIGKQIARARKGGDLEMTWSKNDKTVRVHWKAKGV